VSDMAWESEAGAARVRVDAEAGGRVASLRVEDLELLVPKGADPLRWGLYPMAPFAGRVRRGRFRFAGIERTLATNLPPHAIHGTVFTRPWRDDGGGRFSIDLGAGWPFAGRALQEVSLAPDALSLRLEVHSDGEAFPASLGWHPWFPRRLARGEAVALRIPARAMYVRDAEGIPSGATVAPPPGPWDDCFTEFSAPPEVHWPGALRLCIESSADHFVVYDEPEHAVCVEPQTGPPDALNGAPFIVEPGRPLVATTRLSWSIE
jgi:aldose 1-epimerase